MNKTDIEPLHGYVLVEPDEKPTEVGGIILAGDQQNSAPVRGQVLRVPERGSQFEVGETIYFRKYAIDELKFINEDATEEVVFLIDEREVLGVLRPPVKDKQKDIDAVSQRKLSSKADSEQHKIMKK